MNRLLREPLLHFAVAGALLFALHGWLRGDATTDATATIRLTTPEVAWLRETWRRQWQREPTEEEIRGLVAEFLEEELLAREARALGLEEGDPVVRRHLAQKMSFLIEDAATLVEPSEEELRRLYASAPERFRSQPRISFEHVFFSSERRSDAGADASAALARLARGDAEPAGEGDRMLLDPSFVDVDEATVSGAFGPAFARALFAAGAGGWRGPVASAYGAHVVRVSHASPGEILAFDEVRDRVLAQWRTERRRETDGRTFAALLDRYEVIVDEGVRRLVGDAERSLAARDVM